MSDRCLRLCVPHCFPLGILLPRLLGKRLYLLSCPCLRHPTGFLPRCSLTFKVSVLSFRAFICFPDTLFKLLIKNLKLSLILYQKHKSNASIFYVFPINESFIILRKICHHRQNIVLSLFGSLSRMSYYNRLVRLGGFGNFR